MFFVYTEKVCYFVPFASCFDRKRRGGVLGLIGFMGLLLFPPGHRQAAPGRRGAILVEPGGGGFLVGEGARTTISQDIPNQGKKIQMDHQRGERKERRR